jgi:hypothetical protein
VGWGWYAPSPYFYYPAPVMVAPSSPPTYIESVPAQQTPASNDWFYCDNPDGYYPHIKECPGGWRTVPAQPTQ